MTTLEGLAEVDLPAPCTIVIGPVARLMANVADGSRVWASATTGKHTATLNQASRHTIFMAT